MAIKGNLKAISNNKLYYDEEEKVVYKVFNKKKNLKKEIECINYFKQYLNVPEIVTYNDENELFLSYKFINGKPLASLNTISPYYSELEKIIKVISSQIVNNELIHRNLKKLIYYVKINAPYFYNQIKDDLKNLRIDYLIKAFKPYKNSFNHGDFRTYNIILSPREQLYIIDWEYCGLGDINNDFAYLYMSLRKNDLSNFISYFYDLINIDNFRYFSVYFAIAASLNPKNKLKFKDYYLYLEKIF